MKKESKKTYKNFCVSEKSAIFVVPKRDKDVTCLSEHILNYAFAYPLGFYSRNANSLVLANIKGVRSLFTYFTQLFNLNQMPKQEVKSSTAANNSTRTTSNQVALHTLVGAQKSNKTQSYCVSITAQAICDEGRFLRFKFSPVYNEQNPLTAVGRAVAEFYARRPNGRILNIRVSTVSNVAPTAKKAAKQPANKMPLSQRFLAYAGGLFMLISTVYIIYNLYISW